jgi:type II restriction enzyme
MSKVNKKEPLSEEKKAIIELLNTVERGEIPPTESHLVWEKMTGFRDQYVKRHNEQSWHTFIGHVFEKLIYSVLKTYISELSKKEEFRNLTLLSDSELKRNDILVKKLSVRYGDDQLLLPDTDMAIADCNFADPWNSEIVGIISCKTSLRERIAQACYWKLKLLSSDTTKNVRVFLATTDNDEDFSLKHNKQYGGKSRNRVIAEYELDGIYILRGDFKHEWESSKVKHYDQIFNDLVEIFKKIKKGS